MPLTPQAAAIIEASKQMMPLPMSQLPLDALRAGLDAVPESTTEIFDVRDVAVPTSAGSVTVRVYRPSGATDLPVFQYMHGGGFAIGGLSMHDDLLRQLANAADAVIVSVDYRLAPENPYPAGLDDCVAVWEWLQTAPPEVPADVTRLGVGGDSAGGALAFALALRVRDAGGKVPSAVVSAYGTTEMRISNPDKGVSMLSPEDCTWFWDMYTTDEQDRLSPYCNAANATDLSGLGANLIFTAEYDPTCDATREYAERLAAAGNVVDAVHYDGVMHGFYGMLGLLPEADDAFARTVTFLKDHL